MSSSAFDPKRAARAKTQASFELVLAGMLWGFGFVAATWSLRAMGPLSITGWRFVLAAAVGFLAMSMVKSWRQGISTQVAKLALIPGVLLSITLIFQTWGLQYTSATKSGFLTTLYVILVPLLERYWLKKSLSRYHAYAVAAAMLGVALICDIAGEMTQEGSHGKMAWNFGDVLTLICAVAASFHILWFAKIQDQIGDAFVFNNFQSFWAAIPPLLLSLVFEPWPNPSWSDFSLLGLMMLTFGSTLIAFALQVRAQKIISPSFASLLFLLESPFATLFAVIFLGEILKPMQWLGAGFILLAALATTYFANREES